MSILFIQHSYAQPPNDTCATAQTLVVGVGSCTSILYTNVAATTIGNPATPACWAPNTMSNTVWFSFVATTPDVEISTNFGGTLANTQIAIYSGTCGTLTQIGCQEDVNTAGGLLHTDVILYGLTVGNTYFIAIDGNGNSTGTFGVCVQQSLTLVPLCLLKTALELKHYAVPAHYPYPMVLEELVQLKKPRHVLALLEKDLRTGTHLPPQLLGI